MKKMMTPFRFLMLSLAISFAGLGQVRAAIISEWNFTSANASTFDFHISPTPSFTSSGGSATETISGGVLNYAFSSPGKAGSLNTTVLTFTMAPNHATISGFSVIYDAYTASSAVTALTGTWSVSKNGGGFTAVGSASSITIGSAAGADNNTFTLAGVSIASTDTSLVFALTLSGAAGANSGSMTFDNMEFDAVSVVPEPITYALSIFGLVFVGGGVGRFYLARHCRTA